MKNFASLTTPIVVNSTRFTDFSETIRAIKSGAERGATAVTVNIQNLPAKQQTSEIFKQIVAASSLPIMTINYRGSEQNDEARVGVLELAIAAGFSTVDLPMYLYDYDTKASLRGCSASFAEALPLEVSMSSAAVERQIETVARFKKLGAEVLISAHVGVELTLSQAADLALEMRRRGADIVKIVAACKSASQQLEILRTNVHLAEILGVPFIYTCSGEFSRFVRFAAPSFGTMLIFCNNDYHAGSNAEMPLVSDAVAYFEIAARKNPYK